MKRTTRTATMVITAALALALTACSDDTSSDDTIAQPTATPTVSGPTDPLACPGIPLRKEVPAFSGVVSADSALKVKPKVVAGPTPGPTTLTYFDIVEGKGAELKSGGVGKLKYVGALYKDGKEFDSSWKTSATTTFDITACRPGAIAGFSIGPIGMKVGGRRQINIPFGPGSDNANGADWGYGTAGNLPAVPASTDLIFIVDLVSAEAPAEPTPSASATQPAASAPASPVAPTSAPAATTAP